MSRLQKSPMWVRGVICLTIGLLLGTVIRHAGAAPAPTSARHQTANAPALGKVEVQTTAKTFVVNSKHGSRVAVGRIKLTGKYTGYAVMFYDKGIYRVTAKVNVVKNPKNGNVRVASYQILLRREKYPGEGRSANL